MPRYDTHTHGHLNGANEVVTDIVMEKSHLFRLNFIGRVMDKERFELVTSSMAT